MPNTGPTGAAVPPQPGAPTRFLVSLHSAKPSAAGTNSARDERNQFLGRARRRAVFRQNYIVRDGDAHSAAAHERLAEMLLV